MSGAPSPFPGFSTPAMDAVWTAGSRVSALLEFEAALALALADAGVAPPGEAEAAAAACRRGVADPEGILISTWEAGTPLIALLDEVRDRLAGDDERRWVHHGATSQDSIDTAHMLLARSALEILDDSLTGISRTLAALAETHRTQPHMGRTFLQAARPTTFGRRAAGWLEPFLRHLGRIRDARHDLAVQLGGPVGDLAGYGAAGESVVRALAARLSLQDPTLSWHADRSRIWALVEAVAGPVRWGAKIALDLALLSGSDVEEVALRRGASSSIPGKRNPIDPVRALAAADAFRGAAAMITGAPPSELDRGLGTWHVEWYALPLVFGTASAALEAVGRSLDSLQVDTDAMASLVPPEQIPETQGSDIDRVLALFDEIVGRG